MKVFPQKYPIDPDRPYHLEHNPIETGMDLRDYFAGKAMQAMVNNIEDRRLHAFLAKDKGVTALSILAEDSYEIADAMMKAREK